jgi:hypothetical protein
MAQKFELEKNTTLTASDVVNGHIYVSDWQDNTNGTRWKALEMNTKFENLISDGSIGFQTVVEGRNKTSSNDAPSRITAYQFDEFRIPNFTQDRDIVLDPDLVWLDPGIDNIIYVAGSTIGQVSNQQGTLDEEWRVCISITGDYTDTAKFTSLQFSLAGSAFNAA